MATTNHSTEHIIDEAVHDEHRRSWIDHFTEEERRELMLEDLHAGRTVPWLLGALILAGVTLATTTVLLVWKVL